MTVPKLELMVAPTADVISPDAVAEVTEIFIPAVNPALRTTDRPALNVTVPSVELTTPPMVISLVAPTVVKDTFPNPAAAIAPVVINVPAETDNVTLPVVFVVIVPALKFPVDAV